MIHGLNVQLYLTTYKQTDNNTLSDRQSHPAYKIFSHYTYYQKLNIKL